MAGVISVYTAIDPYSLYRLPLNGADASCGCPNLFCCCEAGKTSTIYADAQRGMLPNEMRGFYDPNKFDEFIADINKTLHNSHWPMLPCILTHFCLPFSPFCASACCASRRTRGIRHVIEAENQRISAEGLYWVPSRLLSGDDDSRVVILSQRYAAELKVHQDTRQRFEAVNPACRKFVPRGAVSVPVTSGAPMHMTMPQSGYQPQPRSPAMQPYQANPVSFPSASAPYSQQPQQQQQYGQQFGYGQQAPQYMPLELPSGPPPQYSQTEGASAATENAFCTKCGAKRQETAFCGGCGNKF